MSEVKKFIAKGVSPHSIVSHLQNELPDIESLFIIVKDKKGNFNEVICGKACDLAFAIIVLQKYLMEHT